MSSAWRTSPKVKSDRPMIVATPVSFCSSPNMSQNAVTEDDVRPEIQIIRRIYRQTDREPQTDTDKQTETQTANKQTDIRQTTNRQIDIQTDIEMVRDKCCGFLFSLTHEM